MLHYKLRNKAYDEGWLFVASGCRPFRKRPLLFLRHDSDIAVVWESTCPMPSDVHFSHSSARDEPRVVKARITKMAHRRFVHSAVVTIERGGQYSLAIKQSNRVVHRGAFPLLRHTDRHGDKDIVIHAAADNQFNVRTFHRLLSRLSGRARRSSEPSFFLHAGDMSQNPHNLVQWQTDFWDPFAAHYALRSKRTMPLLIARGNHDWDDRGLSILTGGPLRRAPLNRGTWYSYSPHERVIIVVLDSNVIIDSPEERAQQQWVKDDVVKGDKWRKSSIRIVVVHVPPFLEYWDAAKWPEEHHWGEYVRTRLAPVLVRAGASIFLSGHSHAYQRGHLDRSAVDALSSLTYAHGSITSSLPQSSSRGSTNGTAFVVFGGAGGTLDTDQVEDYRFYDKTIIGKHHVAIITLRFDLQARSSDVGTYNQVHGDVDECKESVTDAFEWQAIDEDGDSIDRFTLYSTICIGQS